MTWKTQTICVSVTRLARSLAGQSSVCGFSVPLVSREDQRRRFVWPARWFGQASARGSSGPLLARQASAYGASGPPFGWASAWSFSVAQIHTCDCREHGFGFSLSSRLFMKLRFKLRKRRNDIYMLLHRPALTPPPHRQMPGLILRILWKNKYQNTSKCTIYTEELYNLESQKIKH